MASSRPSSAPPRKPRSPAAPAPSGSWAAAADGQFPCTAAWVASPTTGGSGVPPPTNGGSPSPAIWSSTPKS
eukprot:3587829-Alexandrium_andersonii.AAC.1